MKSRFAPSKILAASAAEQYAAMVRRLARQARVAARRSKNLPRPNTPKCKRRSPATPSPAFTAVGLSLLGHPPRPRRHAR